MENRLSTTLFNKKKYKVLSFLLNNLEGQHTITEIAEETELSRPFVSDFINDMRDLGLVEKKRKGNMFLISVDKNSPYLKPLKEVLRIDSRPLKDAAKDFAKEVYQADQEKIDAVVLFGSVARGTPNLNSDIDLLFLLKERDESLERKLSNRAESYNTKLNLNFSLLFFESSKFQEDLEADRILAKRIVEEGEVLAGEKIWES